MVVDLTDEQVAQLMPLFDAAENADKLGLTGMLVAQPFKHVLSGKYQMRVGFLPHEKAKHLRWQAREESQVTQPGDAAK